MHKKNLYSNAERRQLAIGLYEDLERFLESKSKKESSDHARDIARSLAEAFNSQVSRYESLKALSVALFAFCSLCSVYLAIGGTPLATIFFICGAVLGAVGFAVSSRIQGQISARFSDPKQIEWPGSDVAHNQLEVYLENLRSEAQLVHRDGSIFEDIEEGGLWFLAVAKSALSERSKEILGLDERSAPQVFRPSEQIEEPAKPDVPVSTATESGKQDRNWLPDFSSEEFQSLVDEFGSFEIPGKLQPWSRHLLELGKKYSDKHLIKDGRKFRSEFLKYLRGNEIRHPNGRHYEADNLAAVFCMTNNSSRSACRRFLTDERYRNGLRFQQSGDQHELPLPKDESGKIS